MEEKKVNGDNQPKMIPLEEANAQVQNIIQQATARLKEVQGQLQQMDQMLRDKTLEHLFDVIKYASYFELSFVDECVKAITDYLHAILNNKPEESDKTDTEEVIEATKEE